MIYKPKIALRSFILIGLFQSCCFSTRNTPLGNGFKLSEYSYRETSIMYCFDNCCNSGFTVVPQTIVAYNFDKNWIIAKTDSTYHNNQNDFAYWIFKKSISSNAQNMYDSIKANLTGPLDSASFFRILTEKNIQMELLDHQK
jgi:hypothetical protein